MFWRRTYLNPVRFSRVTDGLSRIFMLGENVPAYNQRSQAFFCNGDYASCDPRRTIFPPIRGPIGGNVMSFRSLHPRGRISATWPPPARNEACLPADTG